MFTLILDNRSQKTSKCGKNINDTIFFILTTFHFDIICDLLVNRRTATWNLFVKPRMANTTFATLESKVTLREMSSFVEFTWP